MAYSLISYSYHDFGIKGRGALRVVRTVAVYVASHKAAATSSHIGCGSVRWLTCRLWWLLLVTRHESPLSGCRRL